MSDFSQILQREIDPIEVSEKNLDIKKDEPILSLKDKPTEGKVKKIDNGLGFKKQALGKKRGPKPTPKKEGVEKILSYEVLNPIWLTMSEAAKLGGVQKKTIKRAIGSKVLKYRIVDNRYQVELRSVVLYMAGKKKLYNKLKEYGLGQYIEKWRG